MRRDQVETSMVSQLENGQVLAAQLHPHMGPERVEASFNLCENRAQLLECQFHITDNTF